MWSSFKLIYGRRSAICTFIRPSSSAGLWWRAATWPSPSTTQPPHQLKLKDFVETSFWNKQHGHPVASLDNSRDRSGMDCALLLGALHGGQADLWSDKILEALVADMKERYPINRHSPPYHPEEDRLRGVGIGRYPEDLYERFSFFHESISFLFSCATVQADLEQQPAMTELALAYVGHPWCVPSTRPHLILADDGK